MTLESQPALDVSFEVFPAATPLAERALTRTIRALAPLRPRFFSATSGANGAATDRTAQTLRQARDLDPGLGLAGHITCVGGDRAAKIAAVQGYERAGARWAVALRGDPKDGVGAAFAPEPDGFADAPALIAAIREHTGLRIAVAGYPEPHPDSRGAAADLAHLKRKIDAGADAILTQFFFENEDFYRYVDACRKAGIDVPIIPGIMPIGDFARTARFAARCGATIPARLAERFEKAQERGAARELAMAVCAGQCDELRDQGVRAFHFYTLNKASLTLAVCQALGLDPDKPVDDGGEQAEPENAACSA